MVNGKVDLLRLQIDEKDVFEVTALPLFVCLLGGIVGRQICYILLLILCCHNKSTAIACLEQLKVVGIIVDRMVFFYTKYLAEQRMHHLILNCDTELKGSFEEPSIKIDESFLCGKCLFVVEEIQG